MKTILLFSLLAISALCGDNKIQNQPDILKNNNFFIENKGQWSPEVKYLARVGGMNAWITNTGVVYDYFQINKNYTEEQIYNLTRDKKDEFERKNTSIKGHVIKMQLVDANSFSVQEGNNKNEGYYNYFIGNDQSKWVSFVPLYESVQQNEIYQNINVKYYFDENTIRYDYIIKPGADLSKIKLIFEGQESININDKGELVLKTSLGEVANGKLYSYQSYNGIKKEIACSFTQNEDGTISLNAANYDMTKELIIDPLIYSTFIGGNGSDEGYSIAIDVLGNAYLGGYTGSSNFPTTPGAYKRTLSGGYNDNFVTKINSIGNALVFSTFIGGNIYDECTSLVIDSFGNTYLTGFTSSSNYPTTPGAFQTNFGGGIYDGFVSKINPTGSSLVYSTYIGGNGWDKGNSITVNASGNAYLTGEAGSTNFPTTPGSFQSVKSVYLDVFVTKLNSTGSDLIYSTFIGGNDDDRGESIAIDTAENVYLTGYIKSSDFPVTPGAFQTTFGGCDNNYCEDAFVSKLNPSGSGLIYSTYIGGAGYDAGYSIAIDKSGNSYLTGGTRSSNFPTTPGAYRTTKVAFSEVFITKLNASGDSLNYSTYIGGSEGTSIAIDGLGNSYITGTTGYSNFPTTSGAFQTYLVGYTDAFMSKLNRWGTDLDYSTFIGGYQWDIGNSIAVDTAGNAYLGGYSVSSNYPVTPGAYQSAWGSGVDDAFITKLNMAPTPLKLTSPNDTGIRKGGDTISIAWNSNGISNLKIQYSSDFGVSWNNIVNSYPAATGPYRWILPYISSAQTWIKISNVIDSTVYDISHVSFRIWHIVTSIQNPSAGHNVLDFGQTNIKLDLTVFTPAPITTSYYEYEAPQPGTLPIGITGLTPYYWKISAPNTINFDTAYIMVPISTLRGIEGKDIVWLKRASPGGEWTNIWGVVKNGILTNGKYFSSFSEFTIGFWINLTPVELIGFTAEANNSMVNIRWSTVTETNNRGFEIQRKSSKYDYVTVAFVKGNGTTTIPNNYSWSEKLESGIYSYRLKQVDFNGRSEYSKEVEVTVIPETFILEQNYPNPFNPSTIIRYTVPIESSININVYNTLGENVREYNIGVKQPGFYELYFNANAISSGVYFYSIKTASTDGRNNFSAVKKMMIIK